MSKKYKRPTPAPAASAHLDSVPMFQEDAPAREEPGAEPQQEQAANEDPFAEMFAAAEPEPESELPAEDALGSEETASQADENQGDQHRPRQRHDHGHRNQVQAKQASNIGVVIGSGLAAAGALLMVAVPAMPDAGKPILDFLTRLGVTPIQVLTLGLMLACFMALRRRQVVTENRIVGLGSLSDEIQDMGEAVRSQIDQVSASLAARPPAEGEELQKVMLAMHKQDEKTNNLTRAVKMYGKPLLEITTQVAEVLAQISNMGTRVDATRAALEQRSTKLEEALRGLDPGRTAEAMTSISHAVTSSQQKTGVALQELQTAVTRALTERIGAIEKDLHEMRKHVASSVERLANAGRSDADVAVEASLKQILQGVQNMHASMGRLQVSAPPPTQAAAARTPAATPAASPPPPSAAPAEHPTTAEESSPPEGPGGLAQSISGAKKSGSGGFMSSLEKLKKMRK